MKIISSVLLLFTCLHVQAQDIKTIKLKNQVAEHETKNFYITSVVDERSDTDMIGTVYAGLTNRKVKVNLQSGAATAFQQFIDRDVVQNKAATPIIMHIKKLLVHEERENLAMQATVDIGIALYLRDQLLVEYTGNASQKVGIDATMFVEGLIRKNINETLTRFDEWWGQNSSNYGASGKMVISSVKVSVEAGTATNNPDVITYDPKQPLTLDDFKGEPDDLSRGAAATSSGIQLYYATQMLDGKASLKVTVTPTFNKAKSWCRSNSRDARTLNHEQRHFDITALKACELMTLIKSYNFSAAHYEKELQDLQQKVLKEADEEQATYDKQTNHGTIATEQANWDKNISKRLMAQMCY